MIQDNKFKYRKNKETSDEEKFNDKVNKIYKKKIHEFWDYDLDCYGYLEDKSI